MRFVIITGEYPPVSGGVADYSSQVASGLRKSGISVEVIVFSDACGLDDPCVSYVGAASRPTSLWRASQIIDSAPEECVLFVQYVSQMYGLKGMNLAFVMWLTRRRVKAIWVMFHELYVVAGKGAPLKHRILEYITRWMVSRMAATSDKCFVSISSFIGFVRKFAREGVTVECLPVPSNLPVEVDAIKVIQVRERLLQGTAAPLVGHFGTYGNPLRPLVRDIVVKSRRLHKEWRFVFIGNGSREFLSELEEAGVMPPSYAIASGGVPDIEAALWMKACDVMIQPYPDGASTRRTTLMSSLALGKATVSNLGHGSDSIWKENQSLCLVGGVDPEALVSAVALVLGSAVMRSELEVAAAQCYREQFEVDRTIQRLVRAAKGA